VCEVFSNEELEKAGWVEVIKRRVKECLTEPAEFTIGTDKDSPHAFPRLRGLLLHGRTQALTKTQEDRRELRGWFEQRLHELLSHSQLSNASFDPPELVFCIEGLLACDPEAYGLREILLKSVEVLQAKQEHNPNLRPYRPLLCDDRGFALLPLTIEVFNSLLRSLELLQKHPEMRPVIVGLKPVLRRYVDWLLSQRTHLRTEEGEILTGWCSEHTGSKQTIHVWEVSQVVVFLAHYAAWLKEETERELIEVAGFHPQTIEQPESYWPADPPDQSVYGELRRRLIKPRNDVDGEKEYSVLLFGPPGTGKSTFAAYVAHSLGWDLISLAPSDFLVGGADRVEQRAKSLFSALNELRDKVILFDEIDRLVLDRDSALYEQQGDIFQFMTPSMLPKIQRLRDLERCVFIVATNYEERIDPAIKRPGRIDHGLAVMPPNLEERKAYLKDVADCDDVANKTALYTFAELKRVLKDLKDGKDRDEVLKEGPSFRITNYRSRFGLDLKGDLAEGAFKPPIQEFVQAIEIMWGVGTDLPKDAKKVVDAIKEAYEDTPPYNEQLKDLLTPP
jgi:ATPase family associated with various cellular activities (AAA)